MSAATLEIGYEIFKFCSLLYRVPTNGEAQAIHWESQLFHTKCYLGEKKNRFFICIHLPLHIWTTPVMMMTDNTESLIPVSNIWTRTTQRTHIELKIAIVTVNKIPKIDYD